MIKSALAGGAVVGTGIAFALWRQGIDEFDPDDVTIILVMMGIGMAAGIAGRLAKR